MSLPFLRSVDNVVPSICALGGRGDNVRNITASFRLGNCNTGALPTRQKIREKSFLKFFASEFDDGGNSKGEAGIQRSTRATQAGAIQLLLVKPRLATGSCIMHSMTGLGQDHLTSSQ